MEGHPVQGWFLPCTLSCCIGSECLQLWTGISRLENNYLTCFYSSFLNVYSSHLFQCFTLEVFSVFRHLVVFLWLEICCRIFCFCWLAYEVTGFVICTLFRLVSFLKRNDDVKWGPTPVLVFPHRLKENFRISKQRFSGPQWGYRGYSRYNQKQLVWAQYEYWKPSWSLKITHLYSITLENSSKHKNTQICISLALIAMSSPII